MKKAPIGSISHGTLRTEDLLSSFASTLEDMISINGDHYSRPENFTERDKLNSLINEAQDQWTEDGAKEDGAIDVEKLSHPSMMSQQELVTALEDALCRFAPPYCYFGAHEGDGSDFGFWPCHDQIEELPLITDDPQDVSWADAARRMGEDCKSVNDHGNVTVYSGTGEVLLELV